MVHEIIFGDVFLIRLISLLYHGGDLHGDKILHGSKLHGSLAWVDV